MRSEEVLGRLRDAVLVLDEDKRIEGWLGAASALFGYSAEEAVGRDVDELLKPHDSNGNACCLGPARNQRLLRITKGIPEQEVLAYTKKGDAIWIGVTSSFQRDAKGRIEKSFLVARDINRRKRIDLEKSDVISAVSHELRSPLTSVKGFTSTLINRWDRLDDEQKKHLLYTINIDADRVTRLIGELLDFSRIEMGRVILRRQMLDVRDVVTRVVERVGQRSDKHKVTATFPSAFPSVFADPDKIEQVLTNLVENAVKYSDKGRVEVVGKVDSEVVELSVSDEGEGIPLEQRTAVFGKFFRRGERTSDPSGVGLGLYICKGLVEAHGGKIWVEDSSGGGALFAFTLPISPPEESD